MSSVLALPSEEKPRKAGFSGSGSGNAQHWRCKGRAPTVADSSSEGGRTQEAGEKQISDSYDSWALAFPAAWHVLWPKLRRSTCPQATPCHTYPLSLCPTHAKPFQPAWVSSESLADDSMPRIRLANTHTRGLGMAQKHAGDSSGCIEQEARLCTRVANIATWTAQCESQLAARKEYFVILCSTKVLTHSTCSNICLLGQGRIRHTHFRLCCRRCLSSIQTGSRWNQPHTSGNSATAPKDPD